MYICMHVCMYVGRRVNIYERDVMCHANVNVKVNANRHVSVTVTCKNVTCSMHSVECNM